ncbi:cytochrome C [Mesobacillus maritimus]|uniref:c-type cytochrome n=1 Tax=Mesobacillus maritimus TaxID=1643336 RepID=UPI00203F573B|nr:cytochrome C [Mesobacillus maritimus]MCM3586804.1 cytochrome C [Mesobacillus maritimus]MCM3668841.1 cytochrome C [Mesobacillus maritimus]
MPNSVASFIICAVIGFGIGFAGFEWLGKDDVAPTATQTETASETETPAAESPAAEETEQPAAEPVAASGEILNTKGCLSCHSVSSLDLQGGATGPDLSKAFNEVEGKHGKPLTEFLKEPTSAVMSSVIGGNPLSEEEIQQVVEALKDASEKE